MPSRPLNSAEHCRRAAEIACRHGDLASILCAWPSRPAPVKAAVLASIEAAAPFRF